MDMPRCRDCRWWAKPAERPLEVVMTEDYAAFHDGAGQCDRAFRGGLSPDGALAEEYFGYAGWLITRPDFGCVQFEAKDS